MTCISISMNRFIRGLSGQTTKPKKSNYVTVSDVAKEYHESHQYDVMTDEILSKIVLWRGDITKLKVDAIVNAANESLLGGGGVDGAIHSAAGPDLLKECRTLDGCETGEAKITKGYRLPAKFIIHAVGPRYQGRQKDKFNLTGCYKNSLDLMLKNDLKTIAFPCISTGIYGYPNEDAAHVALDTVHQWLVKNHGSVENIIFCLFLKVDVDIYNQALREIYERSRKDKDSTVNNSAAGKTRIQPQNVNDKTLQECMGDSQNSRGEVPVDSISPEEEVHSQTISEETGMAAGLPDNANNQMTNDHEEKPDNVSIQEPTVLQQSNDEMDTSSQSASTEDNQLIDLSSAERKEWIEKFKSAEVEGAVKPIFEDTEEWLKEKDFESLKLVGGLDISYHKTLSDVASVSLVVLSYPELELLYEDTTIESITVPYIPGYLAYRESEHFRSKLKRVKETKYSPQVILVDGNGALHPRKYGSAVKVGVDADLPTIGVAKNLMVIEEFGIFRDKIGEMKMGGSMVDITSNEDDVLGKAVRTTDTSHKPVFVSVGHKCSLDSAVRIVLGCCRTRIPEPIRQADHLSKMRLKEIPSQGDSDMKSPKP